MPDCRWLRSHLMRWCDLALVTGTTVVNGTIEPILEMAQEKAIFYGISIAGVARLLGLERFCPRFDREGDVARVVVGCFYWGVRSFTNLYASSARSRMLSK